MSIPVVSGAVAGAKVPLGWVRTHPVVFALLVILVGVLAIKFAPRFLEFLGKVPFAGGRVVDFAKNKTTTTTTTAGA